MSRSQSYRIETLVPDGVRPCRAMSCTLTDNTLPFAVPLRVNAGGQTVTDKEGRTWLGDPNVNADELGIRVDPLGGAQVVANWCPADWLGIEELGFDPADPAITNLFQSIRWDVGVDGISWVMEFPVPEENIPSTSSSSSAAAPIATSRSRSRTSWSSRISTTTS